MLTRARWTHVALPVSDLQRSIDFYESLTPLVLVARNTDDSGDGAGLSNEGESDQKVHSTVEDFWDRG